MTKDPFATLGVPATMDIDDADLEARYLGLARASHPDHAGSDVEAQVAAMARSAELNDAYRELRDPWRRARALAERLEPGVLDATKSLDGNFLIEAMELAETVDSCTPAGAAGLEARIESRLRDDLASIRTALAQGDARRAARKLNEARYWQKARSDLRARIGA
ncbi:MAG: Fe-S protein assembly co-chaperone HscB [Planctomycetota bacterium]